MAMSPVLSAAESTDEIMNRTGPFDFLWRQLSRSLIHTQPWLPLTQSASPRYFSPSLTQRRRPRRPFCRAHLFTVIYRRLKSWELSRTANSPTAWPCSTLSELEAVSSYVHFAAIVSNNSHKSVCFQGKVHLAQQFVVHTDHAKIRQLARMNMICTTILCSCTYRLCCQV